MNFVEFTLLQADHDGMLQLGVRVSSATSSAYHESYLYPESLQEFADGLKGFPTAGDEEVVLECGSTDPAWYGYLRLRVFLLKTTGHSALEFECETRGAPPDRAEAHFFIPGMPADFNRMGSALAMWLADPSTPLRIAWQEG